MIALPPTRLPSSATWLKAFVVVVCLAIVMLEGWRDWGEREQEFARIRAEMTNLAKSLAQHAEDTFELADAILTDVEDRVETGGASFEAIEKMDDFLADRISTLPRIKAVSVYGEDGFLLSSSLPGHRYRINGWNLAFFQHHAQSTDQKWFFGPLIRDPLGGDWVLTLSRRVDKPDGSFGGVVQASIPPRYFANFFGRFDVGQQGSLALFDTEGKVLSRYPYLERAIGLDGAPAAMHGLGPAASGSTEYVSGIDGVTRIAGFQRNHIFPVVVLSAVAYDEALAGWNRAFLLRAIGVSLLVIMIGYLGWGFAGELRRREIAEAELAILADTDGLTGLANRRTFDRQLEIEWFRASRDGMPLSLLLIDVDQFKAYNDIYGHQAGDECLRKVAAALAGTADRPGDLVARYGGEEMAILLPDTDASGAATVAENIRARIEALALPHDANGSSGILTISIGSATRRPAFEPSRLGTAELVAMADAALYRAKQEGRNRVSAAQAA